MTRASENALLVGVTVHAERNTAQLTKPPVSRPKFSSVNSLLLEKWEQCIFVWLSEWMTTKYSALSFCLCFIQWSLSQTFSSFPLLCCCLRPRIPLPPSFVFKLLGMGETGEMTRFYFNRDSQSASCIIMRNNISVHTRLFLSPCTLVARQNTFAFSAWWHGWSGALFPTHLF